MKSHKRAAIFVVASLELGSSLAVAQNMTSLPVPMPRPTVALKKAPKPAAHLPSFITRIGQNFEAKLRAGENPSYFDPAQIKTTATEKIRVSYTEIMMDAVLQADFRRYDRKLSKYCPTRNENETEAVLVCNLYSGWQVDPARQTPQGKRFAARGVQARLVTPMRATGGMNFG